MGDEGAELRARLDAEVSAASVAFDKSVTFIAGGALGLSITFINEIAPKPVHTGRIGLAWVLLVIALLASMFSFMTSEWAHRRLYHRSVAGEPLTLGFPGWITGFLNVVAALAVASGIFCVAYFAYGNLAH